MYARGKSYVNPGLVMYVLKTRSKKTRVGLTATKTVSYTHLGVLAAELAAGVQDGVDDGDGRQAGVGLNVHRDAAAVILSLIHI